MLLKKIFNNLIEKSVADNRKNILSLLERNNKAKILDLGCDDGKWTIELAKKAKSKDVFGVEIVKGQAEKAMKLGVKVKIADLNNCLLFGNTFFDIIHANQVIEHIYDLEKFITEIHRVLKWGGYAIISTENLASWHNIFSLILGWQPFSTTNYTLKNLGNPLALHRGEPLSNRKTWRHDKLWAYRGLKEFFENYGFEVEKIKGAGYYPLPSFLGNLDQRHCHWITFKIRKLKK